MRTDPARNAPAIALSEDQARIVRGIVRAVLPDARVLVFGSRATGRARPFSDLDLLFERPDRLEPGQRAALQDLFEASTLPFRVDLVDAAGLAAGMRERVRAEAKAL